MKTHHLVLPFVSALVLGVTGCGDTRTESAGAAAPSTESSGTIYVVRDTLVRATFDATGTAAPVRQATLSTKLMGSVTDVLVREGDRVAAGQLLARIDAAELTAKRTQVSAHVAAADAAHGEASIQVERIRALHRDSAATRAQLDAAESGFAQAAAGLRAARAAVAELEAIAAYATIRAPFDGVVTHRFVDPGAFAAPGAPLVSVLDDTRLRITAYATPDIARALRRDQKLDAIVESARVTATVEGTVPSVTGNLYTINALVENRDRSVPAGGAATLRLPLGERSILVVPVEAIVREGDLTGVTLRRSAADERRWIRLGRLYDGVVEVTSGLRVGDRVVIPFAPSGVAARN